MNKVTKVVAILMTVAVVLIGGFAFVKSRKIN